MTGVGVVSLNLETVELEEVNESIAKSSGFVIGSPTLGGHMPTQVTLAAQKWLIGTSPIFDLKFAIQRADTP